MEEKEEDEEVGRSCDCTLRDHIFVSLPCPGLVRREVGPLIDGVRINNHSMVQAVIFDVCAKTTVNAALKHISNRFKILENI